MSEHPSPFRLEAFMVGETDPQVTEHVKTCEVCRGYIESLRSERTDMLSGLPASKFFESTEIIQAFQAVEKPTRSWFSLKFWVPLTVMAAAAVFLYASVSIKPPIDTNPSKDTVLFKGAPIQTAVILKRGAVQSRHTGRVLVRAHDALRIEVTVAEARTISAGILAADGTYHALATARRLEPGTHIVHSDAIVIDETPTRGTLLVGNPESIEKAAKGLGVKPVAALVIEPEGVAR